MRSLRKPPENNEDMEETEMRNWIRSDWKWFAMSLQMACVPEICKQQK